MFESFVTLFFQGGDGKLDPLCAEALAAVQKAY